MKQESLLEPKIGPLREKVEPELFTDREEILKKIWDWAMLIKRRVASPAALFGQRRMGKTAVLRRLYNKLFWEQDEIVPIYYEVERKKRKIWRQVSEEYFHNYVAQYTAFKLRKPELARRAFRDPSKLAPFVKELPPDNYVRDSFEEYLDSYQNLSEEGLWQYVVESPVSDAFIMRESMVIIVDEFQEFNSTVYWHEDSEKPMDWFTNGFFRTCDSIEAPMLVAGSAVSILARRVLGGGLNGRFTVRWHLEPMSEEQGAELGMRLAKYYQIATDYSTCLTVSQAVGGNPFYITSVFKSPILTDGRLTLDMVDDVVRFEATKGAIFGFWNDHFDDNMEKINTGELAKKIVLFLTKHYGEEVDAKQVGKAFGISFDEANERLQLLCDADLIENIPGFGRYGGLKDKMLLHYIQDRLQWQVENIPYEQISQKISQKIETEVAKIREQLEATYKGKEKNFIGRQGEVFIENVMHKFDDREVDGNQFFNVDKKVFLPKFSVPPHRTYIQPPATRSFQIDVYAEAEIEEEKIGWAVSVKNWESKISPSDIEAFPSALEAAKMERGLNKIVGWIYAKSGASAPAIEFMKQHDLLYSDIDALEKLLRTFEAL